MTKLWLIAQAVLAAVRIRFDGHDVALVAGALMVALGLAWYSIPAAFIVVGGCLVGFAIYGASK
jgi:hypothetical protein